MSILTLLTMITYGGFKMSILVNFEDYKVQLREINEYYEVTESLSASDGLMLAAGLTEYDGKSSIVEDPQYGIV